ncbi:STING domain-containing protein [Flavobacterium sp. RHBU_24]|uniref:STING domain-containing protein n=1 Tax=Flavobacterium sp. RHBU_24 TaxID=3391185 RepID=UPI0039852E85
MKPSLFIGSSSNSLFLAKNIQKILSHELEIKVWDSIKPNEYFLEALYKELFFSDFGLFIIFPDDKIEKKGSRGYTTRDNVIFELGMFVGALGLKRAYFLVIDVIKPDIKFNKLKLPSDLDGIKRAHMKLEFNTDFSLKENELNKASIINACEKIKDHILDINSNISLSLLPSTPLAIGYFRNFILPACSELSANDNFTINDNSYDLTKDIFDFYIIIPSKGVKPSHQAYKKFVKNRNLIQIDSLSKKSPRKFPFFVSSDIIDGRIKLYDLPTTLNSSFEAIRMAMPITAPKGDIQKLELRETFNFKRTLEHLLLEDDSIEFRDNIHIIDINDLINDIQ